MLSPGKGKIGRNDPCPCGSGKKYKRCCLEQQCATHSFWARQRDASDQLTRDMLRFAERKFGDQIQVAWEDFKMTDLPVPLDAYPGEQQIFIPYFLFHWDPQRPRSGKGAIRRGGIVTRWYELEKGGRLSELERLFLEQATTQPLSFFEVLWSEPGERIRLRDILIGGETEVVEQSAYISLSLRADLEPADTLHSRLYGPDPHPAQVEGRGDWSPEAAAKEDRQAKSGFDSRRSCTMPGCDSSQVPNDSGWTVHSPTIGQYGR